jgi:sRNA-binding protein
MPFDAAPLGAPDFSATLFVRSSTEHVSLDALKRDLTAHLDGLSAKLVDLVHHEYAQVSAKVTKKKKKKKKQEKKKKKKKERKKSSLHPRDRFRPSPPHQHTYTFNPHPWNS